MKIEGEHIREFLKRPGMTQTKLAAALGMKQTGVAGLLHREVYISYTDEGLLQAQEINPVPRRRRVAS
jgi:transcriptional regulator with XRE-family HTH domain